MPTANVVGNSNLISNLNRSFILRLIKEQGPMSRAEIAKHLELNPATVGRIVSKLIQNNLLHEIGTAPSQGGRRGTLIAYNPKAGSVIGLDLNGGYMLGVLADLGGDFMCRVEHPASATRDGEENLNIAYGIIEELLHSAPCEPRSLQGIGISCSSVTINPAGIVVLSAVLGWQNVHLRELLEDRFGYPVFVQNQSDLGALAESLWGVAQDTKRLVWLDVGTGIGSGIVINKRLYQGAHHAAGEVGYLVPTPQYLGERFDTFGCMETLASCRAVVRKAQRAIEDGQATSLHETLQRDSDLTITDIFQATREGDPFACQLTDEMADNMSLVILSITSVLDPDMVVLGQELAEAEDLLVPRITGRLHGLAAAMPQIAMSSLGQDAVIRGAVALALEATEEQFYVTHSAFRELFPI